MAKVKYDFGGYATKNNLKCTDGRTIHKDAFKAQDGQTVSLVWQHLHSDPANVLGHAVLENREDGVYAYCKFNDTPSGKNAKELVKHGDINMLSIFANGLKQAGADVLHGVIREVSLVLSGANPGALIDNLNFAHGDGTITHADDEAIIYTGMNFSPTEIEHGTDETPAGSTNQNGKTLSIEEFMAKAGLTVEHAGTKDDKTVDEIFNSLTEEQKTLFHAMIGRALTDGSMEHSNLNDKGELMMKHNVFDSEGNRVTPQKKLTEDQLRTIMHDAIEAGSLKASFMAHAVEYGIENIDYLFPDAKLLSNSPDLVKRRTEWVDGVISGAKHSPFSRIKTMSADLTYDDARAKGYVKGNMKKEEFFGLSKRVTTPTTIYKKQKLDRDDIIDIVDLDVVAWLKAEMRIMLDEEIARAILVGDGRPVEDPANAGQPNPDKIDESHIRPIAKDDNFYAHQVQLASNVTGNNLVEEVIRALAYYKGSGNPTFYTTLGVMTDMLLIKDKLGRRLYASKSELVSALMVKDIIAVEVMEGQTTANGNLLGVIVNMTDYTIGADKGGGISMFDDFDIDYNQYKYLIETRISGALTKPKSALVITRAAGTLVAPTVPTFVGATNTLTIPAKTGVVYLVDGVVTAAGNIIITDDVTVHAEPAEDYYFAANITVDWTFEYVAG